MPLRAKTRQGWAPRSRGEPATNCASSRARNDPGAIVQIDQGFPRVRLRTAEDTASLGIRLASSCQEGLIIFLTGELGAGKTSLARAFIGAMGYQGRITSPSYALVENYRSPSRSIFHFDLYRLAEPEELEHIGIRDYMEPDAVWLVEWPEHGAGVLPSPDLEIALRYARPGRYADLRPSSDSGRELMERSLKS